MKSTEKLIKERIKALEEENTKLYDILDTIENYIRQYNTKELDAKTLCILNDILLIKNGIIKELQGE